MKNIFKPGDQKIYKKIIDKTDTAEFFTGMVHPVYSTFSIARDAEWSGRLFVLELREDDEEGIGTSIKVNHHAPAFPGEEVVFTATLQSIIQQEIITIYKVEAGNRLIATGDQGQKIFKRNKLEKLFLQRR
ncbi:MAG: hypothetical protein H0W75_12285 [Chitinophagaceae bacterium]|jgi:predicted thioesterase|nr:hypothetical protein [Chitinophagaceae bacterium]